MSNHTTAGTKKRSSYHQPHRKPARETLERILSAAEDQLREQELDAFTIQAVLQRTGLSVGAFYSRFPDKTALIHELQERVHLRVEARISNNLSLETEVVQSLEEAVDSGFGVLIRHMLDERRLFSAFIMLSVFDPVMRERGEQFNLERKRAIADLLVPFREQIGHPEVDLAIDSAYAIYSSTMRGRLVYYGSPNDMQFGVNDDILFGNLKRSLALFLRGTDRSPSTASARRKTRKKGDS